MPDFNIRVRVDSSAAVTGARGAERAIDRTTGAADRLRRTLARAFAIFGGVAIIARAVRTIADFGQAMSTVGAITQATGEQFVRLRAEAERLGAETRFSATQAAEGMVFLARAGFNTEQVLATIGGTLELAQAGALGLGRAADIASNVLKGFRLEVSQTARVVDVMALAANSSNTSVEQLGDALKFVAPVAAGVNVSLEETTAAIGALSDAGLQGSLAGTGLRRVLAELESPAKKTQEILASLGVTADEVRVSQVGLIGALRRLAAAGIDTGQALEIFGDRGGPAFEVLSSSIPDVERLAASLGNAEGTAARIARTMDDNLRGALLRVASAFEAIILAAGRVGGEDALINGFNALAEALRAVARNMEIVVEIATRLLAIFVVGRILAFAAAFGSLTGAIAGATVAMRTLLRVFIIPGLIVEGILLIVDSWDAVQRSIDRLNWDSVIVGAADAVSAIIRAFANLPFQLLGVFRALFNIVVRTFDSIARYIGDAVSDAVGNAFKAVTRGELEERLRTVNMDLQQAQRRAAEAVSPDDQLQAGDNATRLFLARADLQRRLQALNTPVIQVGRSLGQELANTVTDELGRAFSAQNNVFRSGPDIASLLLPPDRVADARANVAAIGDDLGNTLVENLRNRVRVFTGSSSDIGFEPGFEQRTPDTTANNQAIDQARRLASATREQVQPAREAAEQQREMNMALSDFQGFASAAALSQEELRLRYLATQNTIASGLERATIRYGQTARDIAGQIESSTTRAFQSMEDALVNFVTTGKLSFGDLARSILADLTRIAVRAALTPIFNSLFGGLAGGGGGFLGGGVGRVPIGFASGGVVRGPGTGTSDSVGALLPAGSFVVNAAATRQHRRALDVIAGAPRFNTGGLVPARVSNGEYLVGPGAASRNIDLLHAINSAPGFQNGGMIDSPRFRGGQGGGRQGEGGRGVVLNLTINGASSEPEVETQSGGTSPDGDEIVNVVVDMVDREIDRGRFDGSLSRRYNVAPALQ